MCNHNWQVIDYADEGLVEVECTKCEASTLMAVTPKDADIYNRPLLPPKLRERLEDILE